MNRVSASDKARIALTGSPQVGGDLKIDQSKHKNVNFNYTPQIQHDGIIGAFNFDLQSLQSEEVIAKRVDEIEEIRSKLGQVTKTGTKVAILKGIGGSGKTTLAKLYADDERSVEPFKNLVWIDAEDSTKVVDNFRQLLELVSPEKGRLIGKHLADAVYNSILRHKTLIVFDNVESYQDISDFLPTVTQLLCPQFIITTRNDLNMPGYRNHWVHVNVLSLEVSKVYIREKLETSQLRIPDVDEKWEELATYFGRLVIALRAATSSIIQQNEKQQFWDEDEQQVYTIKMYLSEIKQVDILHVNDSNSDDPVEITYKPLRQIWTKTLDDLANRPQTLTVQLAERILEVLALLSPTGVPEHWFRTLLQSFLDSNGIRLTTEMNAAAKRLLVSMSLVELSGGKLVIHRLLQTTLLSRHNGAPHLKSELLNWLLPAIAELYSRLRGDNRLQNFHSNMDHLLFNISTDLLENVPNKAVPFLVQLSQSGTESCKKLLKKLIRSVYDERVLVIRENLNLLVTSPQVVEIVLLLPMWFREYGESVTVGEQLGLVNKILNLKVTGWRIAYPFDVHGAGNIYLTIAEVLAKWEPEVTNNNDNFAAVQDALSSVNLLCKTLSKAMKSRQLCLDSYYRNLSAMFSKLKKCLVTSLTVIFSQRVTEGQHLEDMFNSVQVAAQWYLTLEKVESGFKDKPSKTLSIIQLADILAYTGADRTMVQFYEAQLRCYYSTCDSTVKNRKKQIQLEARVAASFSAILDKCASDGQQNEVNRSTLTVTETHLQRGFYLPLEVIPLMKALSNWDVFWYKIFTEDDDSILKAHLLCKGLEPHLQTLKTNFQIDDSDQCRISIQSLAKALRRIFYHRPAFKVIKLFERNGTFKSLKNVATMFPKWRKCAKVTKNILIQCEAMEMWSFEKKVSLFIEECEDRSNQRQIVETFEDYYVDVPDDYCERFKLGEMLRKASVFIRDYTDTPWTCDCLISRCQRMLAGFSLEKGDIEDAITQASKAFEHQLYCAESYSNLVKTVQVLLDAYLKCDDAETRSKKLLGRVIAEHEGWVDCKSRFEGRSRRVQPNLLSQSRLMRYLCSVGLLQEAADVGENFGFGLPQSFSDEFGRNILDLDGLLNVALFLILRGDSDQAMRTLECDHLKSKLADRRYYRYFYQLGPFEPLRIEVASNERSSFLLTLKQIAASISSDSELPSEFNIKLFRTGVFAFTEAYCLDEGEIRDWMADKQEWKNWFKTTKRATWCEKRFGNGKNTMQTLTLFWFETMETILFQKRELLDKTLFLKLENLIEFSKLGGERLFIWTDFKFDWGIKCLLGMYRRQELWFQKAGFPRGLADQAVGGAEPEKAHKHKHTPAANIGSNPLVKRGIPDQKSSKRWLGSLPVSLGFSKR